jgi:hypothetical protein
VQTSSVKSLFLGAAKPTMRLPMQTGSPTGFRKETLHTGSAVAAAQNESSAFRLVSDLLPGEEVGTKMTEGKNAKVCWLSFIVIVGFSVAVGYHYIHGVYLGQPYPWNTFLFEPRASFSDFVDVLRDGHTLNPYGEYSSAQYPFLALLGYIFSLAPRYSYLAYILLVGSSYLFLVGAGLRMESWSGSATHIWIIAFLSYPILIAFDRGNFESLVLVLLLAFIFLFTRERHAWSALCLGMAVALKAYPAILLALYLPERRYRDALLAAGFAVALTFASLLCFRGDLWANVAFLLKGGNLEANLQFIRFTSLSSIEAQRGVSMLTLIKLVSIETGFLRGMADEAFLVWYLAAAVGVAVLVVLYVVFVEKEMWRRAALLVFAMLLLPHISADYKLLHIYLPLLLFVNATSRSRLDPLFVAGFGLLLIPKDYHYLPRVISDAWGANDISVAVPINVTVIALMSLMIVVDGLGHRFRDTARRNVAREITGARS